MFSVPRLAYKLNHFCSQKAGFFNPVKRKENKQTNKRSLIQAIKRRRLANASVYARQLWSQITKIDSEIRQPDSVVRQPDSVIRQPLSQTLWSNSQTMWSDSHTLWSDSHWARLSSNSQTMWSDCQTLWSDRQTLQSDSSRKSVCSFFHYQFRRWIHRHLM